MQSCKRLDTVADYFFPPFFQRLSLRVAAHDEDKRGHIGYNDAPAEEISKKKAHEEIYDPKSEVAPVRIIPATEGPILRIQLGSTLKSPANIDSDKTRSAGEKHIETNVKWRHVGGDFVPQTRHYCWQEIVDWFNCVIC